MFSTQCIPQANVTTYISLMVAFETAVERSDLEQAGALHARLAAFVRGLEPVDRVALEGPSCVPGWSARRIRRLRKRWHALKIHQGGWPGWCRHLRGPGSSASPAASHFELWDAARDLVYAAAPCQHRAELWLFCAGGVGQLAAAQARFCAGRAQQPSLEDADCPMVLDIERTPHLEDGQRETLQHILREHLNRSKACTLPDGKTDVCYVQGMHLLAACPIWAGLEAAPALEVFEYVLSMLCTGYFADATFGAFKRDVMVVEAIIEEWLPKLSSGLAAAEVPVILLAFDPLLCLFALYLPRAAVVRVWDVLLLEGDVAVFAVLLALLELLLPEFAHPQVDPSLTSFPFVDRFHERCSALTADEAEAVVARVRAMLEGEVGSDPPGHSSVPALRQRVQELRRQAASADASPDRPTGYRGRADSWWDQAMSQAMKQAAGAMDQVRGWWRSSGEVDFSVGAGAAEGVPTSPLRHHPGPGSPASPPPPPAACPRPPPSPEREESSSSGVAAAGPCQPM